MSDKRRIALGGIVHETHSFAEIPTTLADFENQGLYKGDAIIEVMSGTRSGLGGMIEGAQKYGLQLLPTLYGAAMPSGVVSGKAFQTMLDELVARLVDVMPIDGVLLALHGAMVTENSVDAESDILEAVRRIVGDHIPIVVELDMHGNISSRTVELADVLVAFDTNPHIDSHARGLETCSILSAILNKQIIPTTAYVSVPMVLAPQVTGTADLPLKIVHERAKQMEAESDVVCISVMAGFAYADTPFTGASLIVTTHNKPDLARDYAEELSQLLIESYPAEALITHSADAAVKKALASDGHPIILVDSADNIGGGTPGDGTDALIAMLANDVQDGTIVLADAEAVEACWSAEVGKSVKLAIGGKTDQWHGTPVTVQGIVQKHSDGIFECELADNHFAAFEGSTIDMGRTVLLRVDGVNIILTTHKTPPFDLAQLRSSGVIPEEQKMIVVKSAVAYQAAYMPIAEGVIEMDTAGLCSSNLNRFAYEHVDKKKLMS